MSCLGEVPSLFFGIGEKKKNGRKGLKKKAEKEK